MRGVRSHLTYANVVATLALVIAVGGGAAYAANTVFSSDIVNSEVKSVDIGNGEVKSVDIAAGEVSNADLAANSVGTNEIIDGLIRSRDIGNSNVKGQDVLDNDLTGTDIAESTLQNVDAGTVGGLHVRKINFQVPFGTGPTTVLDLAGLQITAECQTFGDMLDVKAFTSKNNASVYYFAGSTVAADDTNSIQDIDSAAAAREAFDVGTQFQIDDATPISGTNSIGTLHYRAPDGSVVVADLALDNLDDAGGGCALTGIATGG